MQKTYKANDKIKKEYDEEIMKAVEIKKEKSKKQENVSTTHNKIQNEIHDNDENEG